MLRVIHIASAYVVQFTIMKKKVMIANWKLHPETKREAIKNFRSIKENGKKLRNVETVICSPFVYLNSLSDEVSGHRVQVGAQDVFYENSGSFTGEISPTMLADLKVSYSIVGHSERRALGETNQDVANKVSALIAQSIVPIICVGEQQRDDTNYLSFVKDQVLSGVAEIPKSALPRVMFAYEPLWAIGTSANRSATSKEAQEMKLYIKKVVTDYSSEYGGRVPILYGGSTNPDNTEEFLKDGEVDGLLVGGASLDPDSFTEMLEIANNVTKKLKNT